MALVSVVVPTRNRARYLAEAVESVLGQSHRDLECVVVDGGSTDGTRHLLTAIDDPRLTVIRHDRPRGPGVARNRGLEAASGEYVVFLDDDDRLLEHAVETLVETMREQPRDCAGVYARERRMGERNGSDARSGTCRTVDRYTDAEIRGPSCTLVRAEVCEAVGGFDESFRSQEDADFWIRLFDSRSMVELDRTLFERRYHDGQIVRTPELMLAGERQLLERHGADFSARWRSARYMRIAHFNALLGHTAVARRALRAALRERPRRVQCIYYSLLLLFGSRSYLVGRDGAKSLRDAVSTLRSRT